MAIIPGDLLAQAEDLLSRSEGLSDIPEREALLRTAVSRAYYAVFHEALARARREGYVRSPNGYGSHEGLWEGWFRVGGALDIAEAGLGLKDERTRADYRLRKTISLVPAHGTVEDAHAAYDFLRAR